MTTAPQLKSTARHLTCGNDRIGSTKGPRRPLQRPRGMADLREQIDMTKRTCSKPGCDGPHKARGYCTPHYKQFWRENHTADPCSIDGCGKPSKARSYCDAHYARWNRTGEVGPAEIADPNSGGECSVEGCARKHKARGYCQQHYQRWQNRGHPGPAVIRTKGDSRVRDDQGRKRCTGCSEWRPESDFGSAPRAADKLHCHCYRCHRAGVLRRKYGVTIEWYEELLAAQGGVCALCSKTNGDGRLLAVDHDHACCPGDKSCGNCARALLCTRCNTGLGAFGDDAELMAAAIEYVRTGREARRGVPG